VQRGGQTPRIEQPGRQVDDLQITRCWSDVATGASDISLLRRLFVARVDERVDDDRDKQNQAFDEIL
jgi:hypothetical protein